MFYLLKKKNFWLLGCIWQHVNFSSVFSPKNIFGKGKYFLVFDCILKIVLEKKNCPNQLETHVLFIKKKKKKLLTFRLCLATCKLFFKHKIFSPKNIFEKGKYFLVFCCILKIVLENIFKCLVTFWKCKFSTSFSHFLSFQTNFII